MIKWKKEKTQKTKHKLQTKTRNEQNEPKTKNLGKQKWTQQNGNEQKEKMTNI